jgi:WD40 repeat protein
MVCNGTSSVYMISTETGDVLSSYTCVPSGRMPSPDQDRIMSLSASSRGTHLQCLIDEKRIVTMDMIDEGNLIGVNDGIVVTEKSKYVCHDIVCHPHRNMIATSGTDGCLRLWSS